MKIEISKLERRMVPTLGIPTQLPWTPSTWQLSQTCLKGYQQHLAGNLCGIVFNEYCLKFNLVSPSSEASRKGQYFEYLATGAAPSYGDPVPEPERYKTNGKTPDGSRSWVSGEIKPDWLLPQKQADNFHAYLKHFRARIIQAGVRRSFEGASGNLDIIIQIDRDRWDEFVGSYIMVDGGQEFPAVDTQAPAWEDCTWRDDLGAVHKGCVIQDLKYTALLYDVWNDAGWDIEKLPNKAETMLQAKQYHWLSGGLPFFFWIFSSETEDSRIIRVLFDPGAINQHRDQVAVAIRTIKARMSTDSPTSPAFPAQPSLRSCCECPLREECLFRAKVPRIYAVQAGIVEQA